MDDQDDEVLRVINTIVTNTKHRTVGVKIPGTYAKANAELERLRGVLNSEAVSGWLMALLTISYFLVLFGIESISGVKSADVMQAHTLIIKMWMLFIYFKDSKAINSAGMDDDNIWENSFNLFVLLPVSVGFLIDFVLPANPLLALTPVGLLIHAYNQSSYIDYYEQMLQDAEIRATYKLPESEDSDDKSNS
mgnify:CR=1 FL=1